jgi:excisionase family DNA binding protein
MVARRDVMSRHSQSGRPKQEVYLRTTRISPLAGAASFPASSMQQSYNTAAILTTQEAAALLKTTPRYIQRMVKAGRLRACKPSGKLVRIYRRDLDAFLQSGASIA